MNRSWSTHEPLIKGALWIQIHSCIHTFLMNKAFCGILGTPEDSFGPLRISRWTSWRIPDPWLSWRVWLSLTSLHRLTKYIHQSKLLCGTYSWKAHGPLMSHSWRGGILEIPEDPCGFLVTPPKFMETFRRFMLSNVFSPPNYLHDLFKDIHLLSLALTHEAFMTHWWTTHSRASWKL